METTYSFVHVSSLACGVRASDGHYVFCPTVDCLTAITQKWIYSNQLIEKYMFPDLHRDIHVPRPVQREIRFPDLHLP